MTMVVAARQERYYARDKGDDIPGAASPKRTMLGDNQEKWLYEQFDESKERGAIWNVLGNQVQFSNMNETDALGETTLLGTELGRSRNLANSATLEKAHRPAAQRT